MAAAKGLADSWLKDLKSYLYDDSHLVSRLLGTTEKKLKVKREHVVYALVILFVAYLIFGNFASLVCNFAGFAYPAYVSMKAIESRDNRDDTQWLTYWSVFAVFSMIDPIADDLMGWFSIYWLAKFLFLIWLYLPSTRGAEKLYKTILEPFMTKYSPQIDKAAQEIGEDFKSVAYEVRAEIHGLRERMDSLTQLALENRQGNANEKNNNHAKHEEPKEQPKVRDEPKVVNQPDSHAKSHENTNAHPEQQQHGRFQEEPATNGHKPAIVDHPRTSGNKEPEGSRVTPLVKENSNLNDEKRVSFQTDVKK